MEIKDYRIVKKETHNISNYYVEFKRKFFGFIPFWVLLRKRHFESYYKYDRYVAHVVLFNIIVISANISYGYNPLFVVSYIVGVLYVVWSVVWLYGEFSAKITYGSSIGEDEVKKAVKENIDLFNSFFNKNYKKREIIFSSEEKNKINDFFYFKVKTPTFSDFFDKNFYDEKE